MREFSDLPATVRLGGHSEGTCGFKLARARGSTNMGLRVLLGFQTPR